MEAAVSIDLSRGGKYPAGLDEAKAELARSISLHSANQCALNGDVNHAIHVYRESMELYLLISQCNREKILILNACFFLRGSQKWSE